MFGFSFIFHWISILDFIYLICTNLHITEKNIGLHLVFLVENGNKYVFQHFTFIRTGTCIKTYKWWWECFLWTIFHLQKQTDIFCYEVSQVPGFCRRYFQDTFTIVWQSRKFINLDSSFSAYLYTIMRNRILNMLRDLEYQEQLKDYFVVSSCRCKR